MFQDGFQSQRSLGYESAQVPREQNNSQTVNYKEKNMDRYFLNCCFGFVGFYELKSGKPILRKAVKMQ